MTDIPEIAILLEKVIHEYNQVEMQKHHYGTDILISRTEIHTIVDIGNTPGIGITALANERGITKGAASQMIYKLCAKGLVDKQPSKNSDVEVSLYLTEKGKNAYKGHMNFHKTRGKQFFNLLYSYPPEFIKTWTDFLRQWDKSLIKSIENYKEKK